MARRCGTERALRVVAPVAVGVAFVALWQVLVTAYRVPEYIVPSPLVVARTLVADWGLLWDAALVTMHVTLAALAAAVVLGTLAAFVFVQSRWLEASLFPYAVLLQVTPLVAIAPLVIIWAGDDIPLALTICATIVAVFPIIANTTLGLRSVNPGLADLFRMHRATRLQTLARLRVPSAAPYFFGGLRIASGLALIGAVVAEMAAGTGGRAGGLAYQILVSGFQLNMPRLFAALALITLAGIVLFLATTWLGRLVLGRWHESELGVDR
jgi:NitT/TauT family transport system permease protein